MNIDALVEKAKQLIAIPSTQDNKPALHLAVDYIEAQLRNVPSLTIERFESEGVPSLLAYNGTIRPARFTVLFSGHVDVVPGSADQFIPQVVDGKLYGRGAHDMKTAALVMTELFIEMAPTVPYALGLQIVSDEEANGYNGASYQIQQGVRADIAIMGEHNFERNVIYNAARGICWVEVGFTGKTAHGGYPWEGSNAVMKAANFSQKVLQHYPVPREQIWGTTANISSIKTGNTTFNRVPDEAQVTIDFRFTAEDPNFQSKQHVEGFLQSLDPTAKVLHYRAMEPAVHVSDTNPYLLKLISAVEAVQKTPVKLESRYGGSDSRFFAGIGDNALEYGLYGKGPHSDLEYIEIDSINEYYHALKLFLTSVDDTTRP